jgi:uncharacterized protein (TIGR03083 family)
MTAMASNQATVDVASIPRIARPESIRLAEVELLRTADALEALDEAEWALPTANQLWDVRAMAGHVLGMAETFTSFRNVARDMRAAGKLRGDGPQVDGLTAQQVQLTAALSTTELIDRLRAAAAANPRWRAARRFMRAAPMKEEIPGNAGPETWRMGYLFDIILTRDPWTHRGDLAEATGRPMHLTADHDGRIVADAVADWATRHGQPFALGLTGPAGGTFAHGEGGEEITMDAIEFCRVLSGRPAASEGILAVQVPF